MSTQGLSFLAAVGSVSDHDAYPKAAPQQRADPVNQMESDFQKLAMLNKQIALLHNKISADHDLRIQDRIRRFVSAGFVEPRSGARFKWDVNSDGLNATWDEGSVFIPFKYFLDDGTALYEYELRMSDMRIAVKQLSLWKRIRVLLFKH